MPLFSSCINCGCLLCLTETSDRYTQTHTCTQTGDTESKRREMRSKERRSLKLQGDTGEERQNSSSASILGNRPPHQYENEPAVTVAAVQLPWHFGCLQDGQPQGSEWVCACVRNSVQGLVTAVFQFRSRPLQLKVQTVTTETQTTSLTGSFLLQYTFLNQLSATF